MTDSTKLIERLRAEATALASSFNIDVYGALFDAAAALEAANARIAELEAALTVPDYAMPPDGQDWAKVSPEVAFHLIDRHAENWAHAGQLMEAWRTAVNALESAAKGEPIYQTCFIQGQRRDVDRVEYERAKGLREDLARIVYTAPAATDNAGGRDAIKNAVDLLNNLADRQELAGFPLTAASTRHTAKELAAALSQKAGEQE